MYGKHSGMKLVTRNRTGIEELISLFIFSNKSDMAIKAQPGLEIRTCDIDVYETTNMITPRNLEKYPHKQT